MRILWLRLWPIFLVLLTAGCAFNHIQIHDSTDVVIVTEKSSTQEVETNADVAR